MEETVDQSIEPPACPNCGNELRGMFCFNCGQNQKDTNRFFWSLVNETFEDIFSINSRFSRTLFHLTTKPGFISREYIAGHKARYVPPLRLYIITSLVLVLLLSLQNALNTSLKDLPIIINTDSESVSDIELGGKSEVRTTEEVEAEIEKGVEAMELDWLSEEQAKEFRALVKNQADKAYRVLKDDPSRFVASVLDTLPPLMFVLLPLFALLLKLVYLRSHRFYTEHLVFALHNHSFLYIIWIFGQVIELISRFDGLAVILDWLIFLLNAWIPIYLLLSLKSFYGQGFAMTIFKFTFLSMLYSVLLFFAFIVTLAWSFLTL
jgi:hypothetical protein